jgi:hypothetical protein
MYNSGGGGNGPGNINVGHLSADNAQLNNHGGRQQLTMKKAPPGS